MDPVEKGATASHAHMRSWMESESLGTIGSAQPMNRNTGRQEPRYSMMTANRRTKKPQATDRMLQPKTLMPSSKAYYAPMGKPGREDNDTVMANPVLGM